MAPTASTQFSRRQVVGRIASLLTVGTISGVAVDYTRGKESSTRPTIVGHRGAAGLAPPNTLAGIHRALAYNIDGIELDVQQTEDGRLILFHDPILDWATDSQGYVHETQWEEIQAARIEGEPIPTLTEALDVLADAEVELFLEVKRTGYSEAIVEVVEMYGLRNRLTLTSFESKALAPARDRGVPTGLIGVTPTPTLIDEAKTVGAASVASHYIPGALSEFIKDAQEMELIAGIWNLVETKQSLEAALKTEPDFITTNRPDLALQLLQH